VEVARDVFAEDGPHASLEEIAAPRGADRHAVPAHPRDRRHRRRVRDEVEAARAHADELLRADDALAAFTTWLREQLDKPGPVAALGASVMIASLDETNRFAIVVRGAAARRRRAPRSRSGGRCCTR